MFSYTGKICSFYGIPLKISNAVQQFKLEFFKFPSVCTSGFLEFLVNSQRSAMAAFLRFWRFTHQERKGRKIPIHPRIAPVIAALIFKSVSNSGIIVRTTFQVGCLLLHGCTPNVPANVQKPLWFCYLSLVEIPAFI